ncbi:MAG TPA: DUF6152 family protein [Vicinamibacterales bacterium]|nr:DUF6152 family protein [Vicinamibacterales bacterium]
MKRGSVAAAFAIGLCLATAGVSAHHSFAADFDITKPVTLTGRVSKIEWLNPHVHIYIDVKDGTTWSIELGSPNGLRERGWTTKSLAIGDMITVVGSRAKDGSHLANASSIVLPSGRRLATGSGQGKTS